MRVILHHARAGASTDATLGDELDSFALPLAVAALSVAIACGSSVEPISSPVALQSVSATQLDGTVGRQVDPVPTVRAIDAAGAPVRGVNLFAEITGGNGSMTRTPLITDRDGEATIPWTLGTKVGTNTLEVRAPNSSPVVFTAVAAHGPIEKIEVLGDGELVLPGTTLLEPVSARIFDAYFNPVPGATVTFTVVSGGGTIDRSTAVSDSSGLARAGRWTLGPAGGTQTVSVRAGAMEATLTVNGFICAEPLPGSCPAPLVLAFARQSDGQIYRVRADGFGLTRLTTGGLNLAPAWSPDGSRIAFIHRDSEFGSYNVWVMNADGSNSVERTANANYFSVAWSPDGKRLAVSTEGLYYSKTIVMDADVAGADWNELVIPGSRRPAWSPDGRRIAFIQPSGDDGYETIGVVNADGTDPRQLTPPGGSIWARIAWSPDGSEVFYTDAGTVYAVRADGSGRRTIVSDRRVYGVDVSPDGKWLAVIVAESLSDPSIGYMPIGGGKTTVLKERAYDVMWRPR